MPETPQIDPADRELVASAIRKRQAGETPTAAETKALRRWEKQREDADRARYLATIPKLHWSLMSGRQRKVLDEQAGRYGIPLLGPTIDLAAVARWLPAFLDRNAARLAGADADEAVMSMSGPSPAKTRYWAEKAILAKLDRLVREGVLMERSTAHDCYARVADRLRRCGEVLQRRFGPEALRDFNAALDAAAAEVDAMFAPHETPAAAPVPDEVPT